MSTMALSGGAADRFHREGPEVSSFFLNPLK